MISLKKFSAFIVLIFSFSLSVSAQEAIDLIADASCECIEELQDVDDFAASAEVCIQQAIFANLTSIIEEFDFNFTDEEEATRIGEQIGMEVGLKLVSDCPAFMESMMSSDDFQDDVMDYAAEYEPDTPDNSEVISGTFLGEKVTKAGFSYLIIEDEYGDKTELLWMSPFSGDELITDELEGKKVTISWEPAYIRNGKEKEYIKTKVINGLEN